MSGGGGQTSTTSNAPPQQYLDAYSQLMQRAGQVASTPYQNYPGQLQAGFSPQQEQAFNLIGSTVGQQQPYLNTAAQAFTAAAAPLQPLMQPYVDQAKDYYTTAGNQNLQGALTPYQSQAAQGFGNVANANLPGAISQAQQAAYQGFGAGSQTLTPQQYSADAVQNYYSPYQKSVVDATQKQFDLSNATQQAQLQGNAASQGALGGDRVGVAQAQLAGQQQAQQAPVIAGLMNQGFGQAQQEFNNQQQTNLTAAQQSAMLKQQAAQGYTALGNQSLAAAQGQAGLQSQAAQGFAGLGGQSLQAAQGQAGLYNQTGQGIAALGQQELGAGQSQGWLNAQAGSGLAGLGNEALQGTLASSNALLGAGALQQQQAQTGLNIPYQQWQAQQAYPFQTTSWYGNLAEGLGGASGGSSSSTSPGPSALSQAAGLGATVAGGIGATGGFGSNGWLSNAFSGGGTNADALAYQAALGAGAGTYGPGFRGGGAIHGFAGGGGVPDVSMNGINVGAVPGSQSVIAGSDGVPDVSASIVPGASGFGVPPTSHTTPFLKRDYGSTTQSSGGDSTFGSLVKTGLGVVASIYGTPAAGIATNAALSGVHFGRGGHVPVLSKGFAAGGAPVISVTTVPNPHGGLGIPTMSTNMGGTDAGSSLNDYLTKTAAGAYHAPPTPPPTAAVAPAGPMPGAGPGFTPNGPNVGDATPSNWSDMDWRAELLRESSGGGGAQARGGTVRGFDGGGDVGDDDFIPPDTDFGRVTNQPVGQRLSDFWHGVVRDDQGRAIPVPPQPPSPNTDAYDTPVAKMIPGFVKGLWANQQKQNDAFNAQTARDDEGVAHPDRGFPPPDLDSMDRAIDPLMHGRGTGDGTYPLNQGPAPETHGGGWQPGVAAAGDDDATPAGPAGTTTPGGFGTHGPAGPPVPASTAAAPSGGFGAGPGATPDSGTATKPPVSAGFAGRVPVRRAGKQPGTERGLGQSVAVAHAGRRRHDGGHVAARDDQHRPRCRARPEQLHQDRPGREGAGRQGAGEQGSPGRDPGLSRHHRRHKPAEGRRGDAAGHGLCDRPAVQAGQSNAQRRPAQEQDDGLVSGPGIQQGRGVRPRRGPEYQAAECRRAGPP
jgi:hypothetical protein